MTKTSNKRSKQTNPDNINVAEKILEIRETTHFSRAYVAKKLGVAVVIIRRIELAEKKFRVGAQLAICAVLRIDPELFYKFVRGDNNVKLSQLAIPAQSKEQIGLTDTVLEKSLKHIDKLVAIKLGALLREYRKECKYGLQYVGDLIGQPFSYVSKVETTCRYLSYSELVAFLTVYEKTPAQVVRELVKRVNEYGL